MDVTGGALDVPPPALTLRQNVLNVKMADAVHDAQRLKELQALPLSRKIQITQTRIIEWYQHYKGNVCVSFSGGKDSTVLLTIARQIYPDIPAVFSNTGLEFAEIQKHVKTFDNVDIITPSMRFDEVVSTYGYPLIGKDISGAIYYARRISNDKSHNTYKREQLIGIDHRKDGKQSKFDFSRWQALAQELPALISARCCYKMKKQPIHRYQSEKNYLPILGTLAEESVLREQAWIKHGCNAFDSKTPSSQPMSFWTEQDVLTYIVKYGVRIASVYGEVVSYDENGFEYPPTDVLGNISPCLKCSGLQRTGCAFCAYGMHLEKGETRFQQLAKIEPRKYEYAVGGGEWRDNPFYDATAPEYDGEWKNWNPKKIWMPNKKGLGMGKVFDMVNEIYGKKLYRYD